MFKCHVCNSTEGRSELISEVFQIDGEFVLVENIPAIVCARCGEAVFSRETTERVRLMVRQKRKPLKWRKVSVLEYA